MDVTVTDKSLTEITFQVDGGGAITAMHAGVNASVSYDGSTGSLSASVDVWPLLSMVQKNGTQAVKAIIDQAIVDL